MYILVLFIAMVAGGSEKGYPLPTVFDSYALCNEEKIRILHEMAIAYPQAEQDLYHFECKKK